MKALYKVRLKSGDMVVVRSGKYKGRSGKILAVHRDNNSVTVEGVNIVKRHRKPSARHPQGAVEQITKPMPVSKVGVLDPGAKKPSRIGYRIGQKSEKIRVLKPSGKEIK